MPYDIFISCSCRDNPSGRITALKERIEVDYRAFAQEELRYFFDLEEIHGMHDWRHHILKGLREYTFHPQLLPRLSLHLLTPKITIPYIHLS